MPSGETSKVGRMCVFFSRSFGVLSAIRFGLCSVCSICAVVTFFLEATVLGYFFEKAAFLVTLGKYINNWMRFVIYLIFAVIPVLIWCLSASTIVCLGLFFTVAAINFMLAIGTKGDHADYYAKVSWSKVSKQEQGQVDEEEEEEEEEEVEEEMNGDVLTGNIDEVKLTK